MLRTTITLLLLAHTCLARTLPLFEGAGGPAAAVRQGPQTLADVLTVRFLPANNFSIATFPPPAFALQTPHQVHFTLLFGIVNREVFAACDSNGKALSFFGVRDHIAPNLCERTNKYVIRALMFYRTYAALFPALSVALEVFLPTAGVDIGPFQTDAYPRSLSTTYGWAAAASTRIVRHFENDGWNLRGDAGGVTFNRRPYADTTGYRPRNLGGGRTTRYPLRWEPLPQPFDAYGTTGVQEHIVPHIGVRGRPLGSPPKQFQKLRTPPLYKWKNARGRMGPTDRQRVTALLRDMLAETRRLRDPSTLQRAVWWDNKAASVGWFSPFYEFVLKVPHRLSVSLMLGDAVALYDAVLLAWREKRRHDLVRPRSLIRAGYAGQVVRSWRGFGQGIGPINASEWEPVVQTMAHSEYPSASAMLCAAQLRHLEHALRHAFGANFTEPPFLLQLPAGIFTYLSMFQQTMTFSFPSIRAAEHDCAQSRVYAGLHLQPAVSEGVKVGAKLGWSSYKLWIDLDAGVVPGHCHWCVKSGL